MLDGYSYYIKYKLHGDSKYTEFKFEGKYQDLKDTVYQLGKGVALLNNSLIKGMAVVKYICITEQNYDFESNGKHYNQEALIKVFDENIWLYSIPEKYKQQVIDGIRDFYSEKITYNKKKRDSLNKRLTTLQNEKTSLIKMRSNGEITADEFIEMKNTLINDISEIKDQIIKLDTNDDDILDNFQNMVELLVDLSTKWKTMSSSHKVGIINNIVVELKIDNKKRLYIEENPFFKALQKVNFNKWWSYLIWK